MPDTSAILLAKYNEHRVQARQHETLRTSLVTFTAAAAGAVLSFAGSKGTQTEFQLAAAGFLFMLGVFAALMAYKHYERFRYHSMLGTEYDKRLRSLDRNTDLENFDLLKEGHEKRFGWIVDARAYKGWILFPLLVAGLGGALFMIRLNGWLTQSPAAAPSAEESMSPEVIAAIIALSGVILSGAISWAIARHSAKTDLRKQQLQLFQLYAEKLQERRLQAYPEAFSILSECAKAVHRGTIKREYLEDALLRFQSWDSANSLLMSGHVANIVFDSQWQLHEALRRSADQLPAPDGLLERIELIELALKEDIGVFAVEFEDNLKFRSYGEVGSAVARRLSGVEKRRKAAQS